MISLAAIVKAGAVCISLLAGDNVLFCTRTGHDDLICDKAKDACQTEAQMTAAWKGHPEKQMEFLLKLYTEGK